MPANPQISKIIHLTIDSDDHSLDVIDAAVVPVVPAPTTVTTLDGVTHTDTPTESWVLRLKLVLDWSSTRPGLAYKLKDQKGESVPFVLNVHQGGTETGSAAEPPISGTVTLVPVAYGGPGNAFATADVDLPITGEPTLDITP